MLPNLDRDLAAFSPPSASRSMRADEAVAHPLLMIAALGVGALGGAAVGRVIGSAIEGKKTGGLSVAVTSFLGLWAGAAIGGTVADKLGWGPGILSRRR